MKKFFVFPILFLSLFFFVSCVEDEDDWGEDVVDTTPGDTGYNPGDTDTGDSGYNPGGDTDTDTGYNPTDPTNPTTDPEPTNPTSDPTGDPTNPTTDPTPTCTPQCTGKSCKDDDGCGKPCGCNDPKETCTDEGICECIPKCEGKNCGDNGCGGTCGECTGENEICGVNQTCECVPQCAGKQCGDNGCGGVCGTCQGDNTICNDEQKCECIPSCEGKLCTEENGCGTLCGCESDEACNQGTGACYKCEQITISALPKPTGSSGRQYYRLESNAYTPNTGDETAEDKFYMDFISSNFSSGNTVDLSQTISKCKSSEGTATNNFICIKITEDFTTSAPKVFVPKTGTLSLETIGSGKLKAKVNSVRFFETDGTNFTSDGRCMDITNEYLQYPAE